MRGFAGAADRGVTRSFDDIRIRTVFQKQRHGILRGAYQFFRSNEDPIAQADILIAKVGGHLGADDLPPVIDVETADGQSAHTIGTKVKRWLEKHPKTPVTADSEA